MFYSYRLGNICYIIVTFWNTLIRQRKYEKYFIINDSIIWTQEEKMKLLAENGYCLTCKFSIVQSFNIANWGSILRSASAKFTLAVKINLYI